MYNAQMTVKGSKLMIEVDLTAGGNMSASGKSIVIASTEGNITLDVKLPPGVAGPIKVGLNIYRTAPQASNSPTA